MADIVNFSTNSIDFDSLVRDLRGYLEYQTEFTDYNFEGSALSTLLNLLAYNTHYNIVYNNFALNESFLDTAYKRESVLSHASTLNYLPRSAKAATAYINVTISEPNYSSLDTVYLPKYSVFTSVVDGSDYTFYTDAPYVFNRDGGIYSCNDIKLVQGTFITLERTYNGDSRQKFVLDNDNVDTSTIQVLVKHGVDVYKFEPASDFFSIDDASKVYFLTINGNGKYQIQFGSGMIGYTLSAGDTVYITYLTCGNDVSGSNGTSSFVYQGSLTSLGLSSKASISITCTQASQGGQPEESTESVRLLAPHIFSTQNRCVTTNDYRYHVMKNFSFVKALNVWGGEDNNPPAYGQVFLSIIPKEGVVLSSAQKNSIQQYLKDKKVLTTIVNIIDPTYIGVVINSTIHFDQSKTVLSELDLKALVTSTIIEYGNNNLVNFNSVLRFSQLSKEIDDCDQAITNNTTRLSLYINIDPVYQYRSDYTFSICNKIYKPNASNESVVSNGFYSDDYPGKVLYLDDDPVNETIRLFYYNDNNQKVIINRNVGKVDYETGTITLSNLAVSSLEDNQWTFFVNPSSYDVMCDKNQFIKIDQNLLKITAVNDTVLSSYQQQAIK